MTSPVDKVLLALDFDHTVMDGNTDVEVQGLVRDGIPPEVRRLYTSKCWTDFMQEVFNLLHKDGVDAAGYSACMRSIRFVGGMKELLQAAEKNEKVEVIIISDSNTVFIEDILGFNGLRVDAVFTNPAEFDATGCLRIRYYHVQDQCELSTRNLCKGQILGDYVKNRAKSGVRFKRIVYVGDGKNDICPALRLGPKDFVFARNGFQLQSIIKNSLKQPLAAEVRYWSHGGEIAPFIEL